MSTLVFDYALGYVECNVCGSGHNKVSVYLDEWNRYDYYRTSRCYGDREVTGLRRDELLAQFDRDNFLMATRRARHAVKRFLFEVRKGIVEKRAAADREAVEYDPITTPEPAPAMELPTWRRVARVPQPAVSWEDFVMNTAAPASSDLTILNEPGITIANNNIMYRAVADWWSPSTEIEDQPF